MYHQQDIPAAGLELAVSCMNIMLRQPLFYTLMTRYSSSPSAISALESAFSIAFSSTIDVY